MNNELPLISVIILTYNNFEFFDQTILGVLEQEYPFKEIIISDDGSEEKAYDEERIKQAVRMARDKKIPITVRRSEKNMGTVINVNEALKLAKGDIIAFLGCGDYYADTVVLKDVAELFAGNNSMVVTSKVEGIYPTGDKRPLIMPEDKYLTLVNGNKSRMLGCLFHLNFFCAPATFYSRKVYEKYGMYDERMKLVEDYPFILKMVLNEVQIDVLNRITVKYLLNGVSRGELSQTVKDDLAVIEEKILLPNVDKCDWFHRRFFLYKYFRKHAGSRKDKILNNIKYPEIMLFWQYVRIRDLIQELKNR